MTVSTETFRARLTTWYKGKRRAKLYRKAADILRDRGRTTGTGVDEDGCLCMLAALAVAGGVPVEDVERNWVFLDDWDLWPELRAQAKYGSRVFDLNDRMPRGEAGDVMVQDILVTAATIAEGGAR